MALYKVQRFLKEKSQHVVGYESKTMSGKDAKTSFHANSLLQSTVGGLGPQT